MNTTSTGAAAAVAGAGAETTDNRLVAPASDIHAEMLAALKEALGLAKLAETLTGCRSDDDYVWGIKEMLESAIAKAEGRAP